MRRLASIVLSGLTACLASTAPARAEIVTVTYNGVVASGNDPVGFFHAGDNLAGVPYKAVYVFDTSLGEIFNSPTWNYALGGTFFGSPSPALSATLTINNVSLAFTPNLYGFVQGISDTASLIQHEVKRLSSDGPLSEYANLIHRLYRFNDNLYPASLTGPFSHTVDFRDDVFAIVQIEYRNPANGLYSAFVHANFAPTSVTISSGVPEPSTWAMMIIGFAAVGFIAYRKAKPAMPAA
jgi:PEP-CTERM motif